jgi:hypothetical protein
MTYATPRWRANRQGRSVHRKGIERGGTELGLASGRVGDASCWVRRGGAGGEIDPARRWRSERRTRGGGGSQ